MAEFEKYEYLDLVCAHLTRERPRATVSVLCKFLRARKYAETDEEAETLVQRMYDAYLIAPEEKVSRQLRVTSSMKYLFNPVKTPDYSLANEKGKDHQTKFTKVDLTELELSGKVVQGPLNHEGRYAVSPIYAMLRVDKGVLYLFRPDEELKIRYMIDVQDPEVFCYFADRKKRDLFNRKSIIVSKLYEKKNEKVAEGRLRHKGQKVPERPLCHLYLITKNKTWKFCIETEDEVAQWKQAFKDLHVQAPKTSPEDDEDQDSLPLKDVLDTPHYRTCFCDFLSEQFALENLHFIEAVDAYRLLTDNQERKDSAKKIYELFIDEAATELVNLDSKTFADVQDRYKNNQYRKTLFDAAYEVVYRMVEVDVYIRFTRSARYKLMISHEEKLVSAPSLKSSGGARKSCLVPAIYDIKQLQKIQSDIMKSTLPREHRHRLAKFTNSFTGKEIVDWMLAHNHARIRPAAIGVCQKLADVGLIRHVEDSFAFKDGAKLFTCEPSTKFKKYPSAVQIKDLMRKSKKYFEGTILLQGTMAYSKVYVVMDCEKKSIYIYRHRGIVTPPFQVIEIKKQKKIEDPILLIAPREEKSKFSLDEKSSETTFDFGGKKTELFLDVDSKLSDSPSISATSSAFQFSSSSSSSSSTSLSPRSTSQFTYPPPSKSDKTPSSASRSLPGTPTKDVVSFSTRPTALSRSGSTTPKGRPAGQSVFSSTSAPTRTTSHSVGSTLGSTTRSTALSVAKKPAEPPTDRPSSTSISNPSSPVSHKRTSQDMPSSMSWGAGLSLKPTLKTGPSSSKNTTAVLTLASGGNSTSISSTPHAALGPDTAPGSLDESSSFIGYLSYGETKFRIHGEKPYRYWKMGVETLASELSSTTDTIETSGSGRSTRSATVARTVAKIDEA